MKTVILAGGLGTRLAEETDHIPKPMVRIGGIPIIEHIMNRYSLFGFNDFVIAAGYKVEVIRDYFEGSKHLFKEKGWKIQIEDTKHKLQNVSGKFATWLGRSFF